LDEENRKIYVIEGRHYRLAFPDKVRLCKAPFRFFRPVDNMLFEKAGGGTELFQELVLNTRLPVVGVRARASKMDRLDRITPLMESGMVEFMPYLDPDTHPRDDDIGSVVSELRDAPSGEHDDIMDAYVHGVRFVNRMYEAFYFVQDGTEGVMPGDALDQDDDETEAEKGTDESEDGSRVSVF
jgi:phage terminase large subunit-like protein